LTGPARTDDRRKVIVRLTARGRDLVDDVVGQHLATEREILAALTPRQQQELARLLRLTLLHLGDLPTLPTTAANETR
jgi:DNA-binding MarR family transcriptional regulator